jgi:GNAT superfamily N-acetyltransferase
VPQSREPLLAVRDAAASDRELLVAFNASMARETEGLELDLGRLASGVAAALADTGRGRYLVAELEGRAAGCLLITREWSDWRDGWVWWIQSVYVDPDSRRRGVYTALHRAVLERARAAGDVVGLRLYVERGNVRAQTTYEKLGMRASHYRLYEAHDPLRG